jgi:quercetin dioxygenase-like cupin family protein
MGEMVTCKITSDQTSGAYSLFEITTQPGDGPPPHVQHWEDESFYVLEGEYEFLDEGRTIRAGVGSLIYVPRGILHTHKNVGEGPGRMLVSQTPGARTSDSSRRSVNRQRSRVGRRFPKAHQILGVSQPSTASRYHPHSASWR